MSDELKLRLSNEQKRFIKTEAAKAGLTMNRYILQYLPFPATFADVDERKKPHRTENIVQKKERIKKLQKLYATQTDNAQKEKLKKQIAELQREVGTYYKNKNNKKGR